MLFHTARGICNDYAGCTTLQDPASGESSGRGISNGYPGFIDEVESTTATKTNHWNSH